MYSNLVSGAGAGQPAAGLPGPCSTGAFGRRPPHDRSGASADERTACEVSPRSRYQSLLPTVLALWLGVAGTSPASFARDVPVPHDQSFSAQWDTRELSETHALWTAVLAEHVDEAGLVDYAAIGPDQRYREYLFRLAHTDPGGLPDDAHKLAFWINAYNALAIQGVLETLPADGKKWSSYSVLAVKLEGKGFFDGLRFQVGGRRYALDEIEKAVLLRYASAVGDRADHYGLVGPRIPDPRVHFALVCCAKGCPPLRRAAYLGQSIDAELGQVTRRFVADRSRCRVDSRRRVLHVSKLLEWYGGDLTKTSYHPHAESVPAFLGRYAAEPRLAESLSSGPWRIEYLDYDWALNLQRQPD